MGVSGVFTRFAISDVTRNLGRTFTTIVGIIIAITLIAGENIALDGIVKARLDDYLDKMPYDFYGTSQNPEHGKVVQAMLDVEGVKEVYVTGHTSIRGEAFNSTGIEAPSNGYFAKRFDIEIRPGENLKLNTSLQRVPLDMYNVSGTVYDKANGTPLAGAVIRFYEDRYGEGSGFDDIMTGFNTPDGHYYVDLPPARYEVLIRHDGYFVHNESLDLTSMSGPLEKDFNVLVPTASVEGYILEDTTGDPLDWSWALIRGESEVSEQSIYTTPEGHFRMVRVPTGDYTLYGYRAATSSDPFFLAKRSLHIEHGQNLVVDLSLPKESSGYNLGVRVRDGTTGGDPAWNFNANLESDVGNGLSFLSFDNWETSGYAAVSFLPGNHTLTINPDGLPETVPDLGSLTPENQTINVTIDDPGYGRLILKVADSGTGKPPALVNALLIDEHGPTELTPNAWGSIDRSVYHGNYTLVVDAERSDRQRGREPDFHFSGIDESTLWLLEEAGYTLNGSLPDGPDEVAIPSQMAQELEIGVGDTIYLVYRQRVTPSDLLTPNQWIERYLNLTVAGFLEPEKDRTDDDFLGTAYPLTNPGFRYALLVDFEHFWDLASEIRTPPGEAVAEYEPAVYFYYFVRLDRAEVIDFLSIEETADRLSFIENRLMMHTGGMDVNIQVGDIQSGLTEYYMWLDSSRFTIFALSLPIIFLGAYMGTIGFELDANRRRRQVGLLKSRGARSRQIMLLLLVEALFMGVIAGILGYFLGVVTSQVFVQGLSDQVPGGSEMVSAPLQLDLGFIVACALLAMLMSLAAAYRHSKRISGLTATEAIHKYSESTASKEYKPTVDILLIGIGIYSYVVTTFISFQHLPSSGNLFITIIIAILLLAATALSPLTPLFFTFGLSRYLVKRHVVVYAKLSGMFRRLTGELHSLVPKNIQRNPRRVVSVSVLIALSLSLGIFITTTQAIEKQHMLDKLDYEIGADISLHAGTTPQMHARIASLPGVEAVVNYTTKSGMLYTEPASLRAVDMDAYLGHANVEGFLVQQGELSSLSWSPNSTPRVVIDSDLAERLALGPGDRITFRYITNASTEGTIDLRVAAVVRYLPGLKESDFYYGNPLDMYLDYRYMDPAMFEYTVHDHLIYTSDGADSSLVAGRIEDIMEGNPYTIRVYSEELAAQEEDSSANSALAVLQLEYFFILLIITFGLGIVMYTSSVERETEMANIVVRGASPRQVAMLLLAESLTIVVLAIIVGLMTGLFTAFSTNQIANASNYTPVLRRFVLSTGVVWVVIITLGSLALAALISTLRISHMKLHQVLRKRGG